MSRPVITITPQAAGELLDERFELQRDCEALRELYELAVDEVGRLRSEVRAFKGGSTVFALALIVSIVGHILRSAL